MPKHKSEDGMWDGKYGLEKDYSFEYSEVMKKGIEGLIESVINSQYADSAPELLSMTLGQIPESKILKLVIHDLMMKTQNEYNAMMLFKYLNNFLDTYQPEESKIVNLYYEALSGGRNLFDVVNNIISSCTPADDKPNENGIDKPTENGNDKPTANVNDKPTEDEVSRIYNGNFLLSFYIKVLSIEFHLCQDLEMRYDDDDREKHQCLISRLFWPNGKIIFKTDNCTNLLISINNLYEKQESSKKRDVLGHLHDLLNLMMKFFIFHKKISEIGAVNSQDFNLIALIVCQLCPDIFKDPEKAAKFLALLDMKWLRALICENLIHKLLYDSWPWETIPITLRKIVRQYMFPPPSCNNDVPKSNKTNFQPSSRKKVCKSNSKGETELHIACRKDKPGTLLELLLKTSDVNVKNSNGLTPLHEACYTKSHMCVFILCSELENHHEKIDFLATSNEGKIPLHFATQYNSVEIAEQLLEKGGPSMLDVKDNKGKRPEDYATSLEMKQLLKKFAVSSIASVVQAENIHSVDTVLKRTPPLLPDIKSYSLYLLFLEYLINDYIEIFHLNKIKRRNKSLLRTIEIHLTKKCSIVPNINDIMARCDDLIFVQNASVMFDEFVKVLSEQTSEAIDISRPLMKFKLTCYLPYLLNNL